MARSGPRILAGRHRGRVLRVGRTARPTEGRVREALFNIWSDRVVGCRFLDLFAGSGAMGLEALSRGATDVIWVEKHGQAVATIRRNLSELKEGAGRVLRLDLPDQASRLADQGAAWDLVYADPPYAFDGHAALADSVAPLLKVGAELAIEHSARLSEDVFDQVAALRVVDRRSWGDCAVTFLAPLGGDA